MRTKYKIEMSDGRKCDITDTSADAAIAAALSQNLGATVVSCRSGLTKKEADELKSIGVNAMAGFIMHDIPAHCAATKEREKRGKRTDATLAMFDDTEIKAASKIAKNNFEHRSVFA